MNQDSEYAIDLALNDLFLPRYHPDDEKNKLVLCTDKAFRELIDYESNKFQVTTPVALGYASTLGFNACSHRTTQDVIIFNIGTLLILWNAIHALLSDPDFLPFLENREENRDRLPKGNPPKFMTWSASNPTVHPNNRVRQSVATRLYVKASSFLLMHELTHILSGHVDYLHNLFGAACPHSEVQADYKIDDDNFAQHPLEYEADGYGIIRSIDSSITNKYFDDLEKYLMSIDDYKKRRTNHSSNLFFTMLAVFIVFRLLDHEYEAKALYSGDHPNTVMRQTYLASIIAFNDRRFSDAPIKAEAWVDILYHCVLEIEKAFARWSNPDFSEKDIPALRYFRAAMELDENYYYSLVNRYKAVKPTLRNNARGSFGSYDLILS